MRSKTVTILVDADFWLRLWRSRTTQATADCAGDAESAAKALWKHCKQHLYEKVKNERKLVHDMYRIFVYDCPPLNKRAHHPITGKSVDFSKTKTARFRKDFHQQLVKQRNVALRRGRLDENQAHWKLKSHAQTKALMTGKIVFESLSEDDFQYYASQKGVDINIGIDIASIAYKRLADRIVLVSGDSDFVPAAKLARREGVEFVLDPLRKPIHADLSEHVDAIQSPLKKAHEDQPTDGTQP